MISNQTYCQGKLMLIYSTEVNRAVENLMKSGKMFSTPGRRESMPVVGGPPRAYSDQSYGMRFFSVAK